MHSTLQKELVVGLRDQLLGIGFRWNTGAQSFRCKTADGWGAIHLAFIRHGNVDFDVTVDFGIRVDPVEEVVFEEDALVPKSERKNTACIGAELGNLTRGEGGLGGTGCDGGSAGGGEDEGAAGGGVGGAGGGVGEYCAEEVDAGNRGPWSWRIVMAKSFDALVKRTASKETRARAARRSRELLAELLLGEVLRRRIAGRRRSKGDWVVTEGVTKEWLDGGRNRGRKRRAGRRRRGFDWITFWQGSREVAAFSQGERGR